MAVIGATQLEPVNVLGQYVQGMELGRQAGARRQQEAEAALARQQEAELKNMLAGATPEQLKDPAFINRLIATPGGVEYAKPLLESTQMQRQSEQENLERQREGYKFIADLTSSATDQASYDMALERLREYGVDTSKIPPTYDPKYVETQRNLAMTAAQRADERLRSRTVGVQERQIGLQEKEFKEEATKGAGESGMVKPPELEKGERWNADEQRVEAVPGSKRYLEQSQAHGEDYGRRNSVEKQRSLAVGKIDKLLSPKNRDAFDNLFGGYKGFVTRELSGKTAALRSELESLKNNMKAAGKQIIGSAGQGAIGQITEREWPILEGMIAELRTTMDVDDARAKMEEIKTFFDGIETTVNDEYETVWGRTQYYKKPKERAAEPPPAAEADVMSEADKILGL